MTKTILIVDDNVDTVSIVTIILEKAGYRVESAFNGQEGYLKAQTLKPDLVLLDIMMPVMDGFSMNRHLKEDSATRNIPVIIVSARGGMGPMFDSQMGDPIQGYMVKPVRTSVLLAKIEEVLKGASHE